MRRSSRNATVVVMVWKGLETVGVCRRDLGGRGDKRRLGDQISESRRELAGVNGGVEDLRREDARSTVLYFTIPCNQNVLKQAGSEKNFEGHRLIS
jgi:hypothetical protein